MKRTDKTLIEQMQISETEIERRMELLNLDNRALDLLANHKPIIEENIDRIVKEFYDKQTDIDEISLLIGDADTLARLSQAQHRYVLDLFSGSCNSDYVNNRLRIGIIHKRIGVGPKLYLSAVRSLKEILNDTLISNSRDQEDLTATLNALDKLLYFDTTLIFDTYITSLIGEIENEKKRTELYAQSLEEKVAERTRQLEQLTKLDPLTNLFNHRAMQEHLERELLIAKRRQSKLSVIYFDVDDFKTINDMQGHLQGDEVLKALARILPSAIREVDMACRYGGDEFCIILPECDTQGSRKICRRIIDEFSNKFPELTLSFGIAETGPDEFSEKEILLRRADSNMYLAKKETGFQICA